MKTVKSFIVMVVMVNLLTLSVYGKSVSYDDAQNIAVNLMYTKTGKKASVDDAVLLTSSGDIFSTGKEYHIVQLKPKGWVIVSGDDVVEPILAYSPDSPLGNSADSLPIAFIEWMDNINSQIKQAKIDLTENNTSLRKKWDTLMVDPEDFLMTAAVETVVTNTIKGPLLTAPTWGQSGYYNDQCPGYQDGEQTVVGCVATAMSQIMNYHKWPITGVGSHSYTSILLGFYQSVNFGGATYKWTSMLNSDKAKISHHAGVAVDMQYNYGGSGAPSFKVSSAFRNYFRYNADDMKYKEHYATSTWHGKLQTEIDNKRPIYYAGYGSYGGHAFICDGYDYGVSKKYHFNWGWDGYADGWFYIDNLNPAGVEFNDNQEAIFGISPKGTVPATPTTITATDSTLTSGVVIGSYSVSGATHYKIYSATSSAGTKTYLGLTYSASYKDTKALAGKKYFYFVKACNSYGCSNYSDYNVGMRAY